MFLKPTSLASLYVFSNSLYVCILPIDFKYIKEILKEIKSLNNDVEEITIEVNPGTVTKQKLLDYLNSRNKLL